MKKLFFLLLLSVSVYGYSQHYNPQAFDLQQKKFTLDGGMLSLVAEKNLLELKEQTMITVRLNWVNNEEDADGGIPQQYDYRFEDPSKAPWKITKWEILDGGGELKMGADNYYAVYHAPAAMPAKKCATVAVTMMPQDPTKPKVQLLETIYIADNDNVFYFDCPYLGINQEKYVIKNNGGAMAPSDASVNKAINSKNKAAQKRVQEYTIKAPAADITATEHGFNLAALTSNAKAIYAKEENVTTITINDDKVAMVNGKPGTSKRIFNIVFSFPGKGTGSFKIKSNKKISATVVLPRSLQGIACSCADDPDDPDHTPPTCSGGTIVITKNDGKYIEGYIYANLEAQDYTVNPPPTFYGTLNGKFKVPLAN